MRRRVLLGCLTLSLWACDGDKPPPAPLASASAAAHSAPAASSGLPVAPVRPPLTLGCRLIQFKGAGRAGGMPIAKGQLTDGRNPVTLEKDASASYKHVSSGREFVVEGPARFVPCRGGEEVLTLSEGTVRSSPSVGVRPGAEMLVATPLGLVRYGDAQLELRASGRSVEMKVTAGEVSIQAGSGRLQGKPRVTGPKGSSKLVAPPKLDPIKIIEKCAELASQSQVAAQAVLKPPPDAGSLGERAAGHANARRAARNQCAEAAAALLTIDDDTKLKPLALRLERAERQWRAVPRVH